MNEKRVAMFQLTSKIIENSKKTIKMRKSPRNVRFLPDVQRF